METPVEFWGVGKRLANARGGVQSILLLQIGVSHLVPTNPNVQTVGKTLFDLGGAGGLLQVQGQDPTIRNLVFRANLGSKQGEGSGFQAGCGVQQPSVIIYNALVDHHGGTPNGGVGIGLFVGLRVVLKGPELVVHDQLRSGGRPLPLRPMLQGVDGEGQFRVIAPFFAQFQAVGAQVAQLVLDYGKAPPRAPLCVTR